MAESGITIEHPNRAKSASKAFRAATAALLVISAVLILIVVIGGWSAQTGAQGIAAAFAIVDLVLAYYVLKWNRGVLPLAAALGIFMAIFAFVATPGWFTRDRFGYAEPTIPSEVLGVITALIVPVSILLIAVAMRAFGQQWNVEVERRSEQPPYAGVPQSA